MKFIDLPLDSLVLYTYHYSADGILPEVARTIRRISTDSVCIETIHSTFFHTTNVTTMDSDKRSTLISIVSSVDDAMQRFPELFI